METSSPLTPLGSRPPTKKARTTTDDSDDVPVPEITQVCYSTLSFAYQRLLIVVHSVRLTDTRLHFITDGLCLSHVAFGHIWSGSRPNLVGPSRSCRAWASDLYRPSSWSTQCHWGPLGILLYLHRIGRSRCVFLIGP